MRIRSIQLDHFGHQAQLQLNDLSDGLNVVVGPQGAGKSSLTAFLRWMLYGGGENARRESRLDDLQTGTGPSARGRLAVHHRGRQQTIARQDDGTRYGRVQLDGIDHLGVETNHLMPLLADVTLSDFDRIFAPNFDHEPDLSALLQAAQVRGINLATTCLPSERGQQLRMRIDHLRRDMERLPWRGESLSDLLRRRDTLHGRIVTLEQDHVKRRGSLQVEYDDLNRQIQIRESDIERLRGDWHAKDQELSDRRLALEDAWRRAEEAKQEYLRQRRHDLADVETHLARARTMLTEMRQRSERLTGSLRDYDVERPGRSTDVTNCQVRSLVTQLDQLRAATSVGAHAHPPTTYQACSNLAWTYDQNALGQLRTDLGRLCDQLQQARDDTQAGALQAELRQLGQCEESTAHWISSLQRQRDQLAEELDQAERFGVSLVLDRSGPSADVELESPGLIDPSRIRAVFHACDGYQPIAPQDDRLLQQLTRQRDAVRGEVEAAERYLRSLLSRRRELEPALERFASSEAAGIRRELVEVESQLRVAEDRQRLLDEVHRLEAELATLHADWVHAPVTQRAAETLRRLSGGQLVGLRVEGSNSVLVERADGGCVASNQLNRESRDTLYLSFCLAIITVLRDRGIELPLLLSDAFIHINAHRDAVLVETIASFARKGFQVVVFTRHPHVAELFERLQARVFVLGPVQLEASRPVPSVEQVRFRHHVEATGRGPATWRAAAHRTAERPRRPHYENVTLINESVTGEPNYAPAPVIRSGQITAGTLLDHLDLLDHREAPTFRAVGVTTVGDLLDADATTLLAALQRAGLAERPVLRWQDELALCVGVGDLTLADARVLTSCGVSTIGQLAQQDPDSLCHQVERYLASSPARSGSSPLYRLSRDRAAQWIQSARAAYHGWQSPEPPRLWNESEDSDWAAENPVVQVDHPSVRSPRRSRSARTNGELRRSDRRRASGAPKRKGPGRPRFFLQAGDAVVDAPSIGPRTAERLRKAKIVTVADLVHADPERTATLIKHAPITADVIRQWQAQALLACAIPGLRGHDAQILVACDLVCPEQVAQISPKELWGRVRPLIRTPQGKRILRNSQRPDPDEIREWISWAKQARPLKVAS